MKTHNKHSNAKSATGNRSRSKKKWSKKNLDPFKDIPESLFETKEQLHHARYERLKAHLTPHCMRMPTPNLYCKQLNLFHVGDENSGPVILNFPLEGSILLKWIYEFIFHQKVAPEMILNVIKESYLFEREVTCKNFSNIEMDITSMTLHSIINEFDWTMGSGKGDEVINTLLQVDSKYRSRYYLEY